VNRKKVKMESVFHLLTTRLSAKAADSHVAVHIQTEKVLIGTPVPVTVYVMSQPTSAPVNAVLILKAD